MPTTCPRSSAGAWPPSCSTRWSRRRAGADRGPARQDERAGRSGPRPADADAVDAVAVPVTDEGGVRGLAVAEHAVGYPGPKVELQEVGVAAPDGQRGAARAGPAPDQHRVRR